MRGAKRTSAYLLVIILLATSLPGSIMGAPSGDRPDDDSLRMIYQDTTITYHLMTEGDMEELQSVIGVREPGADYNIQIEGHGTGLAPPSESEWQSMLGQAIIIDSYDTPLGDVLASSYDLSALSTFPKVGNQGSQGSCAAWAMTYYCYGFIEAADNNWTGASSGTTSQLLSPAWTYNRINDYDHGSSMVGNGWVIEDWGVATMATMPYSASDYTSWGSEEAMREASLHRALSVAYPSDESTSGIKAIIESGKPVTFAIDANQYTACFADNPSAPKIITAAEYDSATTLNHAQTIVGWDDSKTEDGETGAFRVVNSWGTSWGESGYYWLSYSAFAELMQVTTPVYIEDRVDYVPSMGAAFHFDTAPGRDTSFTMRLVDDTSGTTIKSQTYYFRSSFSNGAVPKYPNYVYVDISDFASSYSAQNSRFSLVLTGGASSGNITSFRVERYDGGYVPGEATHISRQASGLPASTSGTFNTVMSPYSTMTLAEALDTSSILFTSSGTVDWVPEVHKTNLGGDALQSGDLANGKSSMLSASVTGPFTLGFDWAVSAGSGDKLECAIDGVSQGIIRGVTDWSHLYLAIAEGTHTVTWTFSKDSVYGRYDDCGYLDNITISTGSTDTVPPTTSLTLSGTMGNNQWYRTAAHVVLAATDIGGAVTQTRYRLDGGSWTTYSGAFDIGADGLHTLDYYSVDSNGNTESTKSNNIKVDKVAPATSSTVDDYDVTLSASDATSGVYRTFYRIDGGAWTLYTAAFSAGSTGSHVVYYNSTDLAGNAESTKQVTVGTSDTVAPTTSISLSGTTGSNGWYLSSVTVYLTATDNVGVAQIRYRIDSGTWITYSSAFLVSSSGSHTISYYSVDTTGNTESTKSQSVKVDLIDPVTTSSVSGYQVTLTSTDAHSGVDDIFYRIDEGSWIQYTSTFSAGTTGAHTISYYCVDMAGNSESPSSVQVGLTDSTPPSTSIVLSGTLGSDEWYKSNVLITLTGTDSGSGLANTYYRWQGSTWVTYGGAITLATEGQRTLEYYSKDKAGNVEGVKSLLIKIDKLAPTSSNSTNDRTVTLTASDSTSGLSSINFRLNGGTWTLYSGPFEVPELWERHLIEYRATDIAGNQEIVHVLYLGEDDTTVPTTEPTLVGQMGSNGWYLSTVSITLLVADDLSGVKETWYRWDSGTWYVYSSSFDLINLGAHNLEFYSVDKMGNKEPTHTLQVAYDDLPPQSNHAQVEDRVILTGTDQHSGIAVVLYSWDGGSFEEYTTTLINPYPLVDHTLRYYALDLAGNSETLHEVMIPGDRTTNFEAPSEPVNLEVVSTDGHLRLSWSEPKQDGNATVRGYKIYRSSVPASEIYLGWSSSLGFDDLSVAPGTTYYYYLRANNSIGDSGPSVEVSELFVTPPTAPTQFLIVLGDDSVRLSWAAPVSDGGSPLLSYTLVRTYGTGGEGTNWELSTATLNFEDSTVQEGFIYRYRLYASNGYGAGENVERSVYCPYDYPPILSIQGALWNHTVSLSWGAPVGEVPSGYRIYRSLLSDDLNPTALADVNELTYNDTLWETGRTYYYRVSALYQDKAGPLSAQVRIFLPNPSPELPEAPTGLDCIVEDGGITLIWSYAEEQRSLVLGFNIYRGTLSNLEDAVLIASLNDTKYWDGSMTDDSRYYYQVTALNDRGESERSNMASASLLDPREYPPQAPTGLNAFVDGNLVHLYWSEPEYQGTGAFLGYRIYRSVDGREAGLIGSVSDLDFIDSSTIVGVSYSYFVCAYNVVGESTWVGPNIVTRTSSGTGDPTVPNVIQAIIVDGQASISWESAIGNVIGYQLLRGTTPEGLVLIATLPAEEHSYIDPEGEVGMYYAVAAIYEEGVAPRCFATMVVGPSADQPEFMSGLPFLQPWFILMLVAMVGALMSIAMISRRKK